MALRQRAGGKKADKAVKAEATATEAAKAEEQDGVAPSSAFLSVLGQFTIPTVVLMAIPVPHLGLRLAASVLWFHALVYYHTGTLGKAAKEEWRLRHIFAIASSIFFVAPDAFLCHFDRLEFPDSAAYTTIFGVSDVMAGMWSIPFLFILAVADYRGLSGGSIAGAAVFWTAEVATAVLPIWRAKNVELIFGGFASYLVLPLFLVSASTIFFFRMARGHGSAGLILAAALNAYFYLRVCLLSLFLHKELEFEAAFMRVAPGF